VQEIEEEEIIIIDDEDGDVPEDEPVPEDDPTPEEEVPTPEESTGRKVQSSRILTKSEQISNIHIRTTNIQKLKQCISLHESNASLKSQAKSLVAAWKQNQIIDSELTSLLEIHGC